MISVNFKVLQTSVAVRTAGCRKGQWRNKAPKAFSCPDFGAPKIGPKPLKSPGGAIFTRFRSGEVTQWLTGAKAGLLRPVWPARRSLLAWKFSPSQFVFSKRGSKKGPVPCRAISGRTKGTKPLQIQCSAVPPGFRPAQRRAALKRRNGARRPALIEAVRAGRSGANFGTHPRGSPFSR